jgi:hypothetical protein
VDRNGSRPTPSPAPVGDRIPDIGSLVQSVIRRRRAQRSSFEERVRAMARRLKPSRGDGLV